MKHTVDGCEILHQLTAMNVTMKVIMKVTMNRDYNGIFMG